MTDLDCWQCSRSADPEEILWGAVLLPRAANRGGPVLLFACRHCGTRNLVDRNGAGETMLGSPAAAGYRPPDSDEAEAYASLRWAERNRERRRGFLARTSAASEREPVQPEPVARRPAASEPTGPPPRVDRETVDRVDPDLSDALDLIDAYEIFGLPLTAGEGEIRDRYRDLARKCHPDRVSDLDDDIRRLADRKFRRLMSAYELIRRRNDPPGPSGSHS